MRRSRAIGCCKASRLLFDLDLHRVDHGHRYDPFGFLAVPLEQRLNRRAQRRFGLTGHGQESHFYVA